ncbi:hypothetical protein, conserved [Babesia bigemina]|uniref:Apicoplast import protein Tic20 n=1 Tax=Babesia bigemina TaxID=5866 RepID=A0A061DD72_BABBI|nr:hypothetical protein, conserved [Babesia bigemina]CDR97154.1 hypothetical protein, conserved [Babesia bigemina]|eukprot:XP_012769340.1 hypothetical protein, conserved [Babesia bigemina]
MLFRLLYTAVLVARWSVFASAGAVARPSRAFILAAGRDLPPCTRLRHRQGGASFGGVAVRKAERPFEIRSLNSDTASILDRSSNALYETLSQGSYASPVECLAASAAYVLPLMDAVEGIHRLSQFYTQVPFLSYTMSTLIYSSLVKKNQLNTSYFVRYHFLQSLILSSFQNALAMFYFKLLPIDASSQDFVSVVCMMSAVMSSFGAVFYCVFHAIIGRFAALPIISDAVQLHIGEIPSNEILKRRTTDTDSAIAMR